MKLLLKLLLRQHLYERISTDDLMSRQRFSLFRILSFTGFGVSLFTAIQISATFEGSSLTATLMYILATVIMVNFLTVNNLTKLPIAYSVALIGTFLVCSLAQEVGLCLQLQQF